MIKITPAQKKWKRQMRELQREGKVPEGEGPRKHKIKLPSVGRIIIIVVLIYLVYSFGIPQINKEFNSSFQPIEPSPTDFNLTNMKSNLGLKNNKINNYLQNSKQVTYKLEEITNKWNSHLYNIDKYKNSQIIGDLTELRKLVTDLDTNNKIFINLQYIHNEYLITYEELLMNINNPLFDFTYLIDRLNQLKSERHNEVIRLLEENYIQYRILEDGSIMYWN